MKKLLTTTSVLVALATTAHADKCDSAITQRDMNECHQRVQRAEEAKMTRVYETLMRTEDESLRILLRAPQSAWAQYRELQCDMETHGVSGGSVRPMVVAICFTEKARARKTELDNLANCEEGNFSCTRF